MPTALKPNLAKTNISGEISRKKAIIGLASYPRSLATQNIVAVRSMRIKIARIYTSRTIFLTYITPSLSPIRSTRNLHNKRIYKLQRRRIWLEATRAVAKMGQLYAQALPIPTIKEGPQA